MRQQKRRPSLSSPARNRESWRAPSLPPPPSPRPPPARPLDTHRGVCPRPARPCCHRPAPADTGAPSALSAGRRGARGQLTRHLAKNTAASHLYCSGAPTQRAANAIGSFSLHYRARRENTAPRARGVLGGETGPATEPHRPPSPTGHRAAGAVAEAGAGHTQPMRPGSSKLYSALALPRPPGNPPQASVSSAKSVCAPWLICIFPALPSYPRLQIKQLIPESEPEPQ